MRRRPQRRLVEIYFVLYLAALVLLLPENDSTDKEKQNAIITAVLQQSFNAIPEQPVLNCIIDPLESKIIRFDSVNHVQFGGYVKDIRYEAVIEDQFAGQSLKLVSDEPSPTPMFSINYNSALQTARFLWKPPINSEKRNRTFLVKVVASATPIANESNTDLNTLIQKTGTRVRTETSFSLNVVYAQSQAISKIDTVIMQNPFENPPIGSVTTPNPLSYGVMTAQPQLEQIQAIATQTWSNSVFIGGINSNADLKRTPTVRLEGSGAQQGGSAEISDVRGNQFIITGKAPLSGLLKVVVMAERRADGKQVTTSFIIEPQALLQPSIPNEMNPGISYTFDPRMPQISGTEIKAFLRDARGNEIVSSQRGGVFNFTPSLSDTGKTLSFERWVGGRRIGQPINISVKDYPAPEIVDILPGEQNNVIQVKTRCFGLVKGKKNEAKLEVIEGNATVRDMRGSIQYMDNNITIQTFKITTVGIVKFRAYDQRGVRSAVRRGGE